MALLKTLSSKKAFCLSEQLFARVTFLAVRSGRPVSRGFAFVRALVSDLTTNFPGLFRCCFGVRMLLFGCGAHGKRRLRLLGCFGLFLFLFLFGLLFDARKLAQNFLAFLGSLTSSGELHAKHLLDDGVEFRAR